MAAARKANVNKLERRQRVRASVMMQLEANPELKRAYRKLVKNLPAEQQAITEFLQKYPESVENLAVRLQTFVRDTLPDAREALDRSSSVIGYSYGSGYAGLVCTIIMSQGGVKLGIVGSANLPDPTHLLEGAGKRHRYINFIEMVDFHRPGIRDLLQAASTRCRSKS
ncbi:MAG: hypothetical protein JO354_08180 [Verrucomicrobia bacterium]|nr:hypothetical protein [Verrucomicrobiota bacterium]